MSVIYLFSVNLKVIPKIRYSTSNQLKAYITLLERAQCLELQLYLMKHVEEYVLKEIKARKTNEK